MSFTKKARLNHKEARTVEQKELMARIENDGVCPFCKENFISYHPKPIIKENDSWFLTENMSPYEGTIQHFLFVYKPSHVTRPSELKTVDQTRLFELINWVITKYDVPGGSFFMRFGEGEYNGSSVEHLHTQLIVGEKKSDNTKSLRVKLGYRKAN